MCHKQSSSAGKTPESQYILGYNLDWFPNFKSYHRHWTFFSFFALTRLIILKDCLVIEVWTNHVRTQQYPTARLGTCRWHKLQIFTTLSRSDLPVHLCAHFDKAPQP